MGLFANMAAKSEMKVRDQVLGLVRDFRPDYSCGNVLLPCHIIEETHNGFYVDSGNMMVAIFRCQLHWWGREIDSDTLTGLQSPLSREYLRTVSSIPPTDMGPLLGGVVEFAATLASYLE
jgi:hypothetical protein